MKLEYSSRALAQLASVHEYLSARSPGSARKVTASIRSTIKRLLELPLLGKITDEADIHVLIEPEYRYRVFYRISGEKVSVIRILHGSRD